MGWYQFTSNTRGLGRLGPSDGQARIRSFDPARVAQLIETRTIPSGEAGTVATLGIMSELAQKAAQDPVFATLAQEIVRGIDSKDYEGEARRIYDWVARNVKFRNDPRNLEYISAPYYLAMVRGEEDCESIACLLIALGLCVNLKGGFITYKCDPSRPDDWSHVVAVLGWSQGGRANWRVCDTTYMGPDRGFGWLPPKSKYWDSRFWPVAT